MRYLLAGIITLALIACSREAPLPDAVAGSWAQQTKAPAAAIRLQVAGSLAYASDVAKLTATLRGFSGPFRFTTSNPHVIELLLVPPPAGRALPAVSSPHGVIWAYASGPGTATITAHAPNSSAWHRFTVTLLGRVDVDPPNANFFGPSNGEGKRVTVSQQNFTGRFVENDNCKGIATVRAERNAAGHAAYLVTPGGIGTCQAWFGGGVRLSVGSLFIGVQP